MGAASKLGMAEEHHVLSCFSWKIGPPPIKYGPLVWRRCDTSIQRCMTGKWLFGMIVCLLFVVTSVNRKGLVAGKQQARRRICVARATIVRNQYSLQLFSPQKEMSERRKALRALLMMFLRALYAVSAWRRWPRRRVTVPSDPHGDTCVLEETLKAATCAAAGARNPTTVVNHALRCFGWKRSLYIPMVPQVSGFRFVWVLFSTVPVLLLSTELSRL